jgi:hypothetical protein
MLSDHRAGDRPVISRRTALAIAGVGVTAAAAGVSHVAGATETRARTLHGPIVVQVRDLASGTLDVFVGTRRVQIRDRALAHKLVDAADRGK